MINGKLNIVERKNTRYLNMGDGGVANNKIILLKGKVARLMFFCLLKL